MAAGWIVDTEVRIPTEMEVLYPESLVNAMLVISPFVLSKGTRIRTAAGVA
jgi:hypothetical protein